MLAFLLDENLPQSIVERVASVCPKAAVESIYTFQGGWLEGKSDKLVISAAAKSKRTLVTGDVKTIRPLIRKLSIRGETHGGVIFIHHKTFPYDNVQAIAKALVKLWITRNTDDWVSHVEFLKP